MDVIAAIRDHLLERLGDRLNLDHYTLPCPPWSRPGCCSINWTHPTSNPKLKQKALEYTISLCDGYATLRCADLSMNVFEYADPAFPDNLLSCLPVLALPREAALPQGDAVTPDLGETR